MNGSCLLSYLGIKGYGGMNNTAKAPVAQKNAVKVLGYWDIFKNYYANKQEENYYMIGSNDPLYVKINNVAIAEPYNIPLNLGAIKRGAYSPTA